MLTALLVFLSSVSFALAPSGVDVLSQNASIEEFLNWGQEIYHADIKEKGTPLCETFTVISDASLSEKEARFVFVSALNAKGMSFLPWENGYATRSVRTSCRDEDVIEICTPKFAGEVTWATAVLDDNVEFFEAAIRRRLSKNGLIERMPRSRLFVISDTAQVVAQLRQMQSMRADKID